MEQLASLTKQSRPQLVKPTKNLNLTKERLTQAINKTIMRIRNSSTAHLIRVFLPAGKIVLHTF